MKKLIVIFALILSVMTSCKKDLIPCNCGLVVSDRATDYSVVIRNSCSGNERRFYLQPGDWMNAFVGEDYCITNISNW